MEIFAAHDESGSLRGVFVPAPDLDETVVLEPEPDELVSRVDIPELVNRRDTDALHAVVSEHLPTR